LRCLTLPHPPPPTCPAAAKKLVLTFGTTALAVVLAAVVSYVAASPTFGWTGRSLSLLDPTYASKYIPIIASVSEHQPPSWSSYFTDLHLASLLAPAGMLLCFRPLTDASLFLLLYGVTAVYFSGVMVRLMLVLAPAACCLAGLALSEVTAYLAASLAAAPRGEDKQEGRAEAAGGRRAHAGMPAPHCILRIEQPAPPRLLLHASQRVPTPLPTRTPPTQRSPPAPRRAPPGRPPRRAASTPGRAALAAAAAGWLAPGTRCPATSPSWAWCWCLGA
jgi:hypothetical protein